MRSGGRIGMWLPGSQLALFHRIASNTAVISGCATAQTLRNVLPLAAAP